MAFEITRQEILKQAIDLKKLYDTTRIQKYKDEELRLRRIILELEAFTTGAGSGVTQIIAGTGVTISPVGGTGIVTINASGFPTLTTTGSSGAATLIGGVLNIPNYGSALTGYVPYTGATTNVNLGTHQLLAARGTFANNGSSDTLTVNHTSGSGYGVVITKGGNNEALYVNKTSGSGNAATIIGGITLISELNLTTDLADSHIASAATWNAKQNAITLTTTGNSGAATFVSSTLNIPNYTLAGLGGQPALSGTGFVKISGTTISYDNSSYYLASNPAGYTTNTGTVTSIVAGTGLSGGTITTSGTIALANTTVTAGSYTLASITVDAQGRITAASSGSAGGTGTVTSVAMTVPTGLTVTGSPITTSGTLAVALQSGYSIPTTTSQTNWDTAFSWGNHATAGYLTSQPWVISGSNIYYNTGNVGVGTASPATRLHVSAASATFRVTNTTNSAFVDFGFPSAGGGDPCLSMNVTGVTNGRIFQRQISTKDVFVGDIDPNNGALNFRANGTTHMKLNTTGNLLVGTTTDGGFKLDVNGTIRSSGVITASGGTSTNWNTAFGWGDHSTQGYITGTTGFTGVFSVPTNPPGQQNLDIQNGLIVNIF